MCVRITDAFLQQQYALGNDLITKRGGFPGLKSDDKWCVCAGRWSQANKSNLAPPVYLEATNKKTLEILNMSISELQKHAVKME